MKQKLILQITELDNSYKTALVNNFQHKQMVDELLNTLVDSAIMRNQLLADPSLSFDEVLDINTSHFSNVLNGPLFSQIKHSLDKLATEIEEGFTLKTQETPSLNPEAAASSSFAINKETPSKSSYYPSSYHQSPMRNYSLSFLKPLDQQYFTYPGWNEPMKYIASRLDPSQFTECERCLDRVDVEKPREEIPQRGLFSGKTTPETQASTKHTPQNKILELLEKAAKEDAKKSLKKEKIGSQEKSNKTSLNKSPEKINSQMNGGS